MLLGWPVLAAFGIVVWSCRQPEDAATQAAEDDEQAAYLAEWRAAQVRYKNRRHAKDTRGQAEAADIVQRACHAKLRAELGR